MQQDGADNTADSSFKHVEEDDKTVDENDKLRMDMFDKFGTQNSIIHDEEFSKSDPQTKKKTISPSLVNNKNKKDNTDLNKEVINQILDHNLHLQRNKAKLIVPDVITADNTLWSVETRGRYTVYKDYIPANVPLPANGESVTLTTQGTHEFLHHSIELCDRWDGYISLAVYAPGDDFRLVLNMIYYLRQCANRCVADRIHWHLVFETIYAPRNASAATAFLETQNFDCNIPMESTIRLYNLDSNFRETKGLPYPINVLRNVARLNSKTKYIFASDIELYPSVGIVQAFFKLLKREKLGQVGLINPKNPHVYVTPIFEVKESVKAPRTKKELIEMFKKSKLFDVNIVFKLILVFFSNYSCLQRRQSFSIDMFVIFVKTFLTATNGFLNILSVIMRAAPLLTYFVLHVAIVAEANGNHFTLELMLSHFTMKDLRGMEKEIKCHR